MNRTSDNIFSNPFGRIGQRQNISYNRVRIMNVFYFSILILAVTLFGCKSSILDDPSITIKYSVPEKSIVKLTIENSYNTIMETPVDKEQNAGAYSVSLNASNYAEGVYFYTIELKGVNSTYYSKITKNLLLVK